MAAGASGSRRWLQLALGVIAMMAISSPQYVWTLFVGPLRTATGGSLAEIQTTLTILIVLQTWFSPAQGYLIDRFGPRNLVMLGCALSGASWVLSAYVDSIPMLYLSYGLIGGLGTGIVYVGVVGLMVRWFPDKRGFATGMAAAGYGIGAMVTTFPIADMLAASGYRQTLLVFGCIMGVVGVVAAFFLKDPGAAILPAAPATATVDCDSRKMLKTPVFWLMFVMMTMMSTGGLMVISQFSVFTKDFGIDKVTVLGFAAIPAALFIDRITNGLTRPAFGWVSDRIGRENTMAIAFIGEGAAIVAMLYARDNPLLYVAMTGVVFFGWGEIFSLFPSTLTDTFGTRHATTNYGFLYMAQGIGSVLGLPVASWIYQTQGSWMPVFGLIVIMDIVTGLLALFVLKPMRQNWIGANRAAAAAE